MTRVDERTGWRLLGFALALLLASLAVIAWRSEAAVEPDVTVSAERHLGVGSCAGSTCHGRQEASGAVVRQDEIKHWQDDSSPAGAHSRAWRVLGSPRGRAIAARLGMGDPQRAPACLGCHADPASTRSGTHLADGVGCEACHGGASRWISSHAAVAGTHAHNVALGMTPLEDPRARASVCLDCHFGSDRPGQLATHQIMAAGHPRIAFELDLFSTLEQHWDEDADYVQRKGKPSAVRLWAVGQASAVARALTVYSGPRGTAGGWPEFTLFDCQTCHRRFTDSPDYRATALANPGRPTPSGTPAFQDENMIMLLAAARVVDPAAGSRFDADARAFHAALAQGRAQGVAAAAKLRGSALALAGSFATRRFDRAETLAIISSVATGAADRYTDYEASAQAVMALDTLLSAMTREHWVRPGAAAGIRGDIDRAYAAVRDSNGYRPLEFRAAIARAGGAIRTL